ncbi:MAG: hypothetical protein ACYSSI_06670 [Planctomycetota bacterium]
MIFKMFLKKLYFSLFFILVIFSAPVFAQGKVHTDHGRFLHHDRADWYRKGFYNLFFHYVANDKLKVGRNFIPDEIKRLISLSNPDSIIAEAKSNFGWTTYPSEIGFTPPLLEKDLMQIYRNIACDLGIPFTIMYNIGRDGQIMERKPEFNRLRLNGEICDRRISYSTGVAEEYLWPQVREIMKKYKPDSFWFDGSCFTVESCFLPVCKDQYRKWMGEEPPSSPDSEQWNRYKNMHRQIYRDFIRKTATMVHNIEPKCLVAFNAAYSIMMPEKPDNEVDYLTHDISEVKIISSMARFYGTQGLPFEIMTPIIIWHDSKVRPSDRFKNLKKAEQVKQEIALTIANGGQYSAWDERTKGRVWIEKRHKFLAEIATWLRARQPWCQESISCPDVSILHSAESLYKFTEKRPTCFDLDIKQVLYNIADALNHQHINHEIIADWRLIEGPIRGKLLILENPCAIPLENVDAIEDFVHDGGKVLLTAKAATSGPDAVAKLLGIKEFALVKKPQDLELNLTDHIQISFNSSIFDVVPVGANVLMTVKLKGQKSTHYPLLIRNHYGKGEVFYCSIPLFFIDRKGGPVRIPDELKKVVIDKILPPSQRIINLNTTDAVEISLRKKGNTYVAHLVNVALGERKGNGLAARLISNIPPVKQCHISVKLPQKPISVTLEPGGRIPQNWRYINGKVEIDVPAFDMHEMVVMSLE